MWDFLLVLGQIPGTDYEITFSQVASLYLLAPLLWVTRKKWLPLSLKRPLHQLIAHFRGKKGRQLKLPL